MGKGTPHRWPLKSGVLLLILIAFWPLSHYKQPGIMLWRHTARFAISLTPNCVNFTFMPPDIGRPDIPFYVTNWFSASSAHMGWVFNGKVGYISNWGISANHTHNAVDWWLNDRDLPVSGPPVDGSPSYLGLLFRHRTAWNWIEFYLLRIPIWMFILPSALLFLRHVYQCFHIPARFLRGHCSTCGYDLRATPDRCPECGYNPHTRWFLAPTISNRIFRYPRSVARFNIRLRRNAFWIATTLILLTVAVLPQQKPAPHVQHITNPPALVASQTPPRDPDDDTPFPIVYNVSDLYAAAEIATNPDDNSYRETFPFERTLLDIFPRGYQHPVRCLRPYLIAELTAEEHLKLIAQIEQLRSIP